MVNKKGYIRTLEAVIGIVIILLFIFSVSPKPKGKTQTVPIAVESSLALITEGINNNETLRAEVYNDVSCKPLPEEYFCNENPVSCINCQLTSYIAENVPPGYQYDYRICDNPTCVLTCDPLLSDCIANLPPTEASVYTADTLVSPPLGSDPRIVRVWMWRPGE